MFTRLKDWFRVPRPGSITHRIYEVGGHSLERPMPDRCPGCGGALILQANSAPPLRRDFVRQRTICADCGFEDDWHQFASAVGR